MQHVQHTILVNNTPNFFSVPFSPHLNARYSSLSRRRSSYKQVASLSPSVFAKAQRYVWKNAFSGIVFCLIVKLLSHLYGLHFCSVWVALAVWKIRLFIHNCGFEVTVLGFSPALCIVVVAASLRPHPRPPTLRLARLKAYGTCHFILVSVPNRQLSCVVR